MKINPSKPLFIVFAALFINNARAQVTVYVSPNGVQSAEASGISNVSTETFDSLPSGPLSYYESQRIDGTYTSSGGAQIKANDQFGGYQQGNYLAVMSGSEITLTLNTPAQYFGFYFTAGDGFNGIDIYSGDTSCLSSPPPR